MLKINPVCPTIQARLRQLEKEEEDVVFFAAAAVQKVGDNLLLRSASDVGHFWTEPWQNIQLDGAKSLQIH